MIPGPQDAAKAATFTGPELLAEARRLATNLNLNGMEYTAAVLRRLVGDLDARTRHERAWIKACCETAAAMRRGEAI